MTNIPSADNIVTDIIHNLSDNPNESGMSAEALKNAFDTGSSNIKTYLQGLETVLQNNFNELDGLTATSRILSLVYPVGSIYLSTKNTNPSTFIGGTWTQLKNAFLFATNATSGDKGTGSGTGTNTGSTTLNANQIPSHSHNFGKYIPASTASWHGEDGGNLSGTQGTYIYSNRGNASSITGTQNTGGGQGHTHTVPYIEVYVWKRTS